MQGDFSEKELIIKNKKRCGRDDFIFCNQYKHILYS